MIIQGTASNTSEVTVCTVNNALCICC